MIVNELKIKYHCGHFDSVFIFNDELNNGFTLAFCRGNKYDYVETHRGHTKIYKSFNALNADYHKITNRYLKSLRIQT